MRNAHEMQGIVVHVIVIEPRVSRDAVPACTASRDSITSHLQPHQVESTHTYRKWSFGIAVT